MDYALEQNGRGNRLTGLIIALIFFLGIGPTLSGLEFSNGIENLNVETALEMRRGGPWLIPTLMEEPRVRKPPLNAWIPALAVRPKAVQDMSSLNAPTREVAWKALSWQTRWPALLGASLTLAFAYELGKTPFGHRVGLYGAIIAGTTLLNRPIKRVKHIPIEPRTQLYVVIQKSSSPAPVPETGWRLLMKTPRDKDWWVAFARDPQ